MSNKGTDPKNVATATEQAGARANRREGIIRAPRLHASSFIPLMNETLLEKQRRLNIERREKVGELSPNNITFKTKYNANIAAAKKRNAITKITSTFPSKPAKLEIPPSPPKPKSLTTTGGKRRTHKRKSKKRSKTLRRH